MVDFCLLEKRQQRSKVPVWSENELRLRIVTYQREELGVIAQAKDNAYDRANVKQMHKWGFLQRFGLRQNARRALTSS